MITELTPRATVRNFLQPFPGLGDATLSQLLGTSEQGAVQNLRIPLDASLSLGSSEEFSPDGRPPTTQLLLLADRSKGGLGTGYLDHQRAIVHRVQAEQGSVGVTGISRVTFATKYRHPDTFGLSVVNARKRWGSLSRAWQNDGLHPGFFGIVVRYVGDETNSRGQHVQQLRLDSLSWLEHGPTRRFVAEMAQYRDAMHQDRAQAHSGLPTHEVVNRVPKWHDLSAYLRAQEAGLNFQTIQLSTDRDSLQSQEHQTPHARVIVTEADAVGGTSMARIEFQPTRPRRDIDPSPLSFTIPRLTRAS